MADVLMPQLSDSMSEGVILSWLIEPGGWVEAGTELVEIETDKATVTHEAEAAGYLEIVVAEGESVSVGEVIAQLSAEPNPAAPELAPNGAAAPVGDSDPADAEQAVQPAADQVAVPAVAAPSLPAGGVRGSTPLARRAATIHGVDLSTIDGSGPGGRITKEDVLARAGVAFEPAVPTMAATPRMDPAPLQPRTDGPNTGETVQKISRLQSLIARRMTEAKATVPHFQVQAEVSLDAAIALRTRIKEEAEEGASVPSINDFVIKACALALREHPRANGSFREDGFVLFERINIGFAVATDDALVVPVLNDADVKPLSAIAAEARQLASRVKDGSIAPAELSGATFTVSNLGMFGMSAIYPVIDLPQAAILGVGQAREVLSRGPDGTIIDKQIATLTLSCDHRILYGADAARFLAAIGEKLQRPHGLAVA